MSKTRISAIVFVCICAAWFAWTWRIPSTGANEKIVDSFTSIPLRAGQWRSDDVRSSVKGDPRLPTASILDRAYRNDDGEVVSLTIVYGTSLGDMHQPEYCLGGGGWATREQSKITLRPAHEPSFLAMLGWMENESEGQQGVALYWFDSAVGKSTLLPWHKIKIYWSRLLGKDVKGVALVRIMVPTAGDEKLAKQSAVEFAQEISPYVDALMAKPPKTALLPS